MNLEQQEACSRLLEEHLQAENDHNIQRIMDTYGQNPLVSINGRLFEGREEIRIFHEKFGFGQSGSFSNIEVRKKNRYLSERAIILEILLRGTHTGIWRGMKATGRSFEIPVCTVYLFDQENRLAEERVYFDSSLLLRQLKA